MKRRTGVQRAAAEAQAAAMSELFETGTDPFGRPVAWATIERTGEQLDMLTDPPVHGPWCGIPCGRPGTCDRGASRDADR